MSTPAVTRRKIKWKLQELEETVQHSTSIRQVLKKLGLREAGGNYTTVSRYIKVLKINTTHLTGRLWSKGKSLPFKPKIPLFKILKNPSYFQSHKLKQRLCREKLKKEACELGGWNRKALDGRIPLELDHINGNRFDSRVENLRVLCPNCHSLQSTHRGKNTSYRADGQVAE